MHTVASFSARLPADLCCYDLSADTLPTNSPAINVKCEGCVNSSTTAQELEQCLQIIVSEYEQEIVRLRTELSVYKYDYQQCNGKTKSQSKNVSESEDELLLYKSIPDFKDEMRRLGDNLWPSDKTTSILYYQAAALNGCTESCVRVALYFLESESSCGLVDYGKAKVIVFFVTMWPIPKLVLRRTSSSARRQSSMRKRRTNSACYITRKKSHPTLRVTLSAWLPLSESP